MSLVCIQRTALIIQSWPIVRYFWALVLVDESIEAGAFGFFACDSAPCLLFGLGSNSGHQPKSRDVANDGLLYEAIINIRLCNTWEDEDEII